MALSGSKKVKIEVAALAVIFVLIVAVLYFTFYSSKFEGASEVGYEGLYQEGQQDPVIAQLSVLKMEVLSDEEFETLIPYSSLPVTPGERGVTNPFGG